MLHRNRMFAYYSPRLRFVEEPPEVPGAAGTPPEPPAPVELGYPANTPVTDMDDKQQAAYWKHYARKHEATANARGDYDDLKAQANELAQLKAKNQTDQERELAAARLEGESAGKFTYLKEAVVGRLLSLTGKTDVELGTVLDLIDVKKFTKDDGALDSEKITTFAKTLGMKASEPNEPPTDAVRAQLERQRNDPKYRGAGSIAELQKQRVAALTPSK